MESLCSDDKEKINKILTRRNQLRYKLAILRQERTQRLQTEANVENVSVRSGDEDAGHSMVSSSSILQEDAEIAVTGLNNSCIYEDHEAEIERIEKSSRLSAQTTLEQSSGEDFSDSGSEYLPSGDDDPATPPERALHPNENINQEENYTVDSRSPPETAPLPNENENQEESHSVDEILAEGDSRKRRRIADPSNWKRKKAKLLRMQGKDYIGFKRRNNKVFHDEPRQARKLGPKCNLKLCVKSSKRKCDSLSENQRKDIFAKFWSEMDWAQRKIYVVSHVKRAAPLRRYTKEGTSKREESLFYHLTVNSDTLQVCKKTFLSTLGIGEFAVRNWIKKSEHGMPTVQQRENVAPDQNEPEHSPNPTNDQNGNRPTNPRSRGGSKSGKRELLVEFFDSLPKLPSHYCRKETRKLYLQEDVKTHSQLFRIYKQYCFDMNKSEKIASRKLFDEVFFVKNLSIFTLKKDKCDACEGFKSGNIEEAIYREHIQKKERAREEKARDKECALKDQCTVLTMDLQALKMAPYLNCNGFYYKTKLCCHNFTVFNLKTLHTRCYWFTECDAELGASTYASCIIDYLKEFCAEEKNKIVIYSDGCTAQNRNVTLANALLDYSVKGKITIQQKYLEVGHTQMECDSVHAAIERRLKNREIHLPSEYGKISREARVKPFPYDVKLLDYTFFKNYAAAGVQRYTSIRPGKKKGDPCVTDIRAIQYNHTGFITVKLNFDEEFQELPQRPKHREEVIWNQLYTSKLKITESKWKHLQELKFALPADTHNFYDNLPYE